MGRIPFGKWTPDIIALAASGSLLRATNVIPRVAGYGVAKGLATVAGATALTARARGALSGIDDGGNALMFAGDETKLYRFRDAGAEDVSRVGGYGAFDAARWEFTQHGDVVIATNYNDPVQAFDTVTSSLFADLALNAPRGRHVCEFKGFLILGNIYDLELGPLVRGISWSAIGNPFSWPTRGSDEAVAAQSDRRVFDGGGFVHAVVSGREVGAVFQENAVHRLDYVGGDLVFNITRVEPTHGLLIPGLAVPFSTGVFYLSEDGFRVFDYSTSHPIGKDTVDKFFFADFDASYPDRVWAIRDPDGTRVLVGYPGAGHVGGRPNRILVWDWMLRSFSLLNVEHESLCRVIDAGVTLDTLPDDIIDDPPYSTTSFDDRTATPGAIRAGAFSSSNVLSDFSGSPLQAELETGEIEFIPGRRSMLSAVRPLVDSTTVKVSASGADLRTSGATAPLFGPQSTPGVDGRCPQRLDARYHRLRFEIPNGFTEASGADVDYYPSGSR